MNSKSIVELLKLIQNRPSVYLGRRWLSCLKAFIDGWYMGNPDLIEDAYIMDEFQDWIFLKYGIQTTQSWCEIIVFFSQDENDALDRFFKLFEEFLKSRD